MPYILSPMIRESMPGLWHENHAYKKENIYSMDNPNHPPINYDSHTLNPHSLTHAEAPAHTQREGRTIDYFFKESPQSFYGPVLVVKLKGSSWQKSGDVSIWKVSLKQLQDGIREASGSEKIPNKIIITLENIPLTDEGLHDPNHVLILSQESADYLISNENFNLYGTSWKSSDYMPGKKERPIHNTLFKRAIIFECLDLKDVPKGEYFFSGFPLALAEASESPVCPVLYTREELSF